MPIYEYACHDCRMVFQFFSKAIGGERNPVCPKCGASDLERLLSSFAALKTSRKSQDESGPAPGGPEGADAAGGEPGMMDDPFANMTPSQQASAEREMMKLMSEAEGLDESDPRQLGHFMERMMSIAGPDASDKQMEEAIRRLKDGEDPEKIEEDMGDVLGMGEDEGGGAGGGGVGGYGYDSGMYDM